MLAAVDICVMIPKAFFCMFSIMVPKSQASDSLQNISTFQKVVRKWQYSSLRKIRSTTLYAFFLAYSTLISMMDSPE